MLDSQRRLCGQEHQETLDTQRNLCDNYVGQRRYIQAEALIQDTLQKFRRILGNNHQETLWVELRLANCLNMQRRFVEAETVARNVLTIVEQTSAQAPVVANAMIQHGIACHGQGRLSEALVLQERAVELSIQGYGFEHPTTKFCKARLAEVVRDLAQTEALGDIGYIGVSWPVVGNYMPF